LETKTKKRFEELRSIAMRNDYRIRRRPALSPKRMTSSFQSVLQPKYVALDTSTWIELYKHRNDQKAKDILDVINSGQIIVYVSFEHFLELVQHSDQNVRLEQLDFFRAATGGGRRSNLSR
jgi:hypothetical protein